MFGTITIVFQFWSNEENSFLLKSPPTRQTGVHFHFHLLGLPKLSIYSFVKEHRVTYVYSFLFMFSTLYPSDHLAQTFPIAKGFGKADYSEV